MKKQFTHTVYLAGAISCFYEQGLEKLATVWRAHAKRCLNDNGYKCFNPCDEPSSCWGYNQSGVITQNYLFLQRSDIILVNLDSLEESPGTIWELSMAWNLHKPVIGFGHTKWEKRAHIQSLVPIQFETIDEAMAYLYDMYSM